MRYKTRREQVRDAWLHIEIISTGHWKVSGYIYNKLTNKTITDSMLIDDYLDINEDNERKSNIAAWRLLKILRKNYKKQFAFCICYILKSTISDEYFIFSVDRKNICC